MRAVGRKALLAEEIRIGAVGGRGRLRVGLLYPSTYPVAMANLAVQTLYRLLNETPEISCERVFLPAPGATADRLTSLETGTALGAFDVVAISSSYELDWLQIPAALRAGGIEPLAADRDQRQPLVLMGGPAVTANPEPVAGIADAIFIGEVEDGLAALTDALLGAVGRQDALERLAALPYVYVPARPPHRPVPRAVVTDLNAWPTRSEILSPHCEFPNVFLLEVGRGCPRGCRFCLTRCIYAPARFRDLEALQDTAELGLRFTTRLGLVGAAVADHPGLLELLCWIVNRGGLVSTSSLRLEAVTPELLEPLVCSGQQSITLAPEVADEHLARVLGKVPDQQALPPALSAAAQVGLQAVKLYFMVGLPGETDAQALAIADLVSELDRQFPSLRFTVSVTPFTPKAHTPLARVEVPTPEVVQDRMRRLQRALRARAGRVQVQAASARWSAVQTVLSRGGQELTPVLLHAGGMGAGELLRALATHGLSLADYLREQAGPRPWQIVDPRPPREVADVG